MHSQREPIDVGSDKQLFLDEMFFASARGVELAMNPPVDGGTCIEADRPWESAAACGWCVVVPDEKAGHVKMYYEASANQPIGPDGLPQPLRSMCCAVSTDGIHWEKPDLGNYEFNGSRDNNIVLMGEADQGKQAVQDGVIVMTEGRAYDQMGSVVIDESDAPERRYKMLFCGSECKMRAAYSPDGLSWTVINDWKPVSDQGADSGNIVLWDPTLGKWVGYFRVWDATRRVARVETDDFENWPNRSAESVVLAPDELDSYDTHLDGPFFIAGQWIDKRLKGMRFDPDGPLEQFMWFTDDENALDGVDFYNQPVTIYPHAARSYVMPFTAFYHRANLLEIQLAVSRDGVHWQRPGDRQPWVRMPFEEDGIRIMYCGPGVVRDGSRLYHYHSYSQSWHGHGRPGQYEPVPVPESSGSVRRAELRLDGYMSVDAGNLEGGFVTPPMVHSGKRLELNVDTSASGWVKVELLDVHGRPIWGYRLEGYALQECDRIIANSTNHTVTWNGNADVSSLAGKPIRMHVRMRNAKLYAFQFVD